MGQARVNGLLASGRLQAQAFVGELRSPERVLSGQLVRFALAGSLVAVVYISVTSALHVLFGVRFQIALAVGFALALCVHFTLQRVFVWGHRGRFALATHRQALRYLLVCSIQYAITVAATSALPGLLGLPVEVVYLATACVVTVCNFVVFRTRVFQARPA